MKIAFITSHLPQECGIATFSGNLAASISVHLPDEDKQITFVAVQQESNEISYPSEVKCIIRQQVLEDYTEAANFINLGGFDLCIIQHEYGIFGGESGVYLQSLVSRLSVPFIVTAHTVLKQPSPKQRSIMKYLAEKGEKIVVMSNKARQFLRDIYEIPAGKIFIIEHGVPKRMDVNREEVLREMHLEGKQLLMTFGLLGRNKGIETVIRALPAVIEKHPRIVYLVQGNTHPNVVRNEGERYREEMNELATRLGVAEHVIFRKGFMTEEKLFELLHSVDIYITPYLNEEQITSGTLSYALGAGAAVVSTPYWHAQELLADGRGRLFNFRDDNQLSEILNSLLDDNHALEMLRSNALSYAHHLRWKNTGKRYVTLAENILKDAKETSRTKVPAIFTEPGLKHVKKLTDQIGMYQHSVFGLPDYHEGYCLDDNARALIAMTMAAQKGFEKRTEAKAEVYLSFIHFMQQQDGWFHNFLGFDRKILDDKCSEDAYGRALWSLGFLLSSGMFPHLQNPAEKIFGKAMHHAKDLQHIRGQANAIIGLRYFLDKYPAHHEAHYFLRTLTEKINEQYRHHRTDDWRWFADSLTYDNGILPLALFHAAEITGDEETKNIAEASAAFLEQETMSKGYLSLIGSNGWYNRNGSKANYPQQAIDAMSMVLMYRQAFNTTNNKHYFDLMIKCYRWFFFENDLCTSLYEPATEGCYDGLEDYGLNQNQGAESTLALFISHYTVAEKSNTIEVGSDVEESLKKFGFVYDEYSAFRKIILKEDTHAAL
jgi:glycosyltransferase involved in cell wall biosynthesis